MTADTYAVFRRTLREYVDYYNTRELLEARLRCQYR